MKIVIDKYSTNEHYETDFSCWQCGHKDCCHYVVTGDCAFQAQIQNVFEFSYCSPNAIGGIREIHIDLDMHSCKPARYHGPVKMQRACDMVEYIKNKFQRRR